jgi:hypothetical protein
LTQNKVIKFLRQHLWWMLLLFLVVLQIPFLQADPDLYLSHSRDAHSDEGLNTIQLRNYINHGYLSVWECDNLMKNPFFNLILYLPFKIFGTNLLVGRLTIMFFTIGSLLLIGSKKEWRKWLTWMIPIVFFQFHVFQYMHFSLAEMMSVSCILLGMFGFVSMWDEQNQKEKLRYLSLGWIFMMLSWYTKIQFVYVTGIAMIFLLVFVIHQIIMEKKLSANTMWVVIFSILIPMAMTYVYYKFWYLEHKDAFEYIMKNQTGNRFPPSQYFWGVIGENLRRYFTTSFVLPVWIGFLISLPIGIYAWIKSNNKLFKRIILFSLIWFLAELHKIEIQHVPSRYLLSGYVSMLCFIGTTMYGVWDLCMQKHSSTNTLLYRLSLVGVIALMSMHFYNYSGAFMNRTYQVKTINDYMKNYDTRSMVVLGPWAPTVTWNTHMRSLPVWKDFLNYEHIKMDYNPDIVVTEPGEADSDGAFCADNFDIVNESDSVKKIWIGKWPVHIYWMKKNE